MFENNDIDLDTRASSASYCLQKEKKKKTNPSNSTSFYIMIYPDINAVTRTYCCILCLSDIKICGSAIGSIADCKSCYGGVQ